MPGCALWCQIVCIMLSLFIVGLFCFLLLVGVDLSKVMFAETGKADPIYERQIDSLQNSKVVKI